MYVHGFILFICWALFEMCLSINQWRIGLDFIRGVEPKVTEGVVAIEQCFPTGGHAPLRRRTAIIGWT